MPWELYYSSPGMLSTCSHFWYQPYVLSLREIPATSGSFQFLVAGCPQLAWRFMFLPLVSSWFVAICLSRHEIASVTHEKGNS